MFSISRRSFRFLHVAVWGQADCPGWNFEKDGCVFEMYDSI